MEPELPAMSSVTCSVCGRHTLLPTVLGEEEDAAAVEDGKVFSSRLENGKLVREQIPVYCVDCFRAAAMKSRGEASGSPNA